MMNDRFSAGLRQHLLDTANDRPADGQLAAVLDRVADTPQHPPLVVRLARFPGRIGPFPSTAVRWALIAAALLGAITATAILSGGGEPSRSTVFEGTWTTIDPDDDSRMTLVVAAGTTPAVHFEDLLSTGGACVADDVKIFTADGAGQVSGTLLAVSFPDGGGCGLMTVDIGPGFYEFDEATDTLTASADGLTWSRAPDLGDQPVIFSSLMIDAPSGANSGTFETSGAASERGLVCPSGVVMDLVEIDSEAVGRGELVDFTVPKQLACDDESGTIAVTLEIHVDLESGTETFAWAIGGGTGAYEGLRGEGHGSTRSPATDRYLNTYWGSVRTGQQPGPATGSPPTQPPPTQPPATPAPTQEPAAQAGCIDLHGGGDYGASVGSLTLTAMLPASTSWEGHPDRFVLSRSGCPNVAPPYYASPVWIEAQVITQVGPDACDRSAPALEVATAAEAIAALADQASIGGPDMVDATLDGYTGSALEMSQPADFDASACTDGVLAPLSGVSSLGPGNILVVHVVDVEGTVLAVAVHWRSAEERANGGLVTEVDAIVASLQIEP